MTIDTKFLRYIVIGLVCLFFELLIFYIFLSYTNLNVFISNTIALIVGILIAFNLNAYFNFKIYDNYLSRMIKSFMVYFSGIILSNLMLHFFLSYASAMVSKILTLPIILIYQYLLNAKWTFRESR